MSIGVLLEYVRTLEYCNQTKRPRKEAVHKGRLSREVVKNFVVCMGEEKTKEERRLEGRGEGG
jgi:hypothetical protein